MYFVYIMSNRSKTLYTGVMNSMIRRVREHKMGVGSGFTTKYKLDRLVYFERFDDVRNAIERRETDQGVVASQENLFDCVGQSGVEGFEFGVVRAASVPTVTWRRRTSTALTAVCIGPSRQERAQDDTALADATAVPCHAERSEAPLYSRLP
jgi:putative endonuclease